MKISKRTREIFPRIVAALVLITGNRSTILAADSPAPGPGMTRAAIHTAPGLVCQVFPIGSTRDKGVWVLTDGDGYARFLAKRATGKDSVQKLQLECRDSAKRTSSFTADLTADQTFRPPPLNLKNEPGVDRPALRGDPESYTIAQLIRGGYGVRPDRQQNPRGYARWLEAASVSGRSLALTQGLSLPATRIPIITRFPAGGLPKPGPPVTPPAAHSVTNQQAQWWTGSVLQGSTGYYSTEATFNVPTAIPGAARTGLTEMAIWNGVGGWGTKAGLIQGGVIVETNSTTASYHSFREYCCGFSENDTHIGGFAPDPGDKIFSQEWYCDSAGNPNMNGGFGCSIVVDLNKEALLNCSSATGSPCPSVQVGAQCSSTPNASGCVLGVSAEFIVENQSPQVNQTTGPGSTFPPENSVYFPVFVPAVDFAGSAASAVSTIETVSNDPSVAVVTESTNVPSHIGVSLGPFDDTFVQWTPWTSQVPGIGGGTSGRPALTMFQNRLYAAWKGAGSDERMFWSSFNGRNWAAQQVGIGGGTSGSPALAVFRNRLYAAWKGAGNDQRMFWSSFDGSTWAPQQVGIGGGTSGNPALVVFQDRLYAAWKGAGGDERMFWSKFDGNAWAPQQVGIGGSTSGDLSLAVFRNRLYAAWKGGGSDERMFWSSFDGNTWAPQQVGIGGGTSVGPSLAVYGNQLYAAWKGGGSDERMFWSSFDGNTWATQQLGVGGGTSLVPSLAVFGDLLFAAWKGVGADQGMYWSFFEPAS